MQEDVACNSRKIVLKDIFKFHYIHNGTSIIQSKSMSFRCPICDGFHLAVGLTDYIPHHDFYLGREFFCGNCLSQFVTIEGERILAISKAIII